MRLFWLAVVLVGALAGYLVSSGLGTRLLHDEIEVQLSRLVAQAGQQLTQAHQQQAAAQQAQQQAQDPMIQMQQAAPHAKAVTLPGVGHYAPEDAPEAIADLVDEFVRAT